LTFFKEPVENNSDFVVEHLFEAQELFTESKDVLLTGDKVSVNLLKTSRYQKMVS